MNATLKTLLDELADECRAYIKATDKLKAADTPEAYDKAEDEVIDAMVHLESHARVMLEHSLEKHSRFEPEEPVTA